MTTRLSPLPHIENHRSSLRSCFLKMLMCILPSTENYQSSLRARLLKAFTCLLLIFGCCAATASLCAATPQSPQIHERYGISFYGIDLPQEGAHLLLIIDVSKSMSRKDAARTTPGRRWDTLLDEVQTMLDEMATATKQRGVPFQVSVIFEGGDEAHRGEGPFIPANPESAKALMALLSGQTFRSGGSFETTFSETLWDVMTRQAITYVIYLGDDDIGHYAESIRESVRSWYTCDEANPTSLQRKRRHQKNVWRKAWSGWRPVKRGMPAFRSTKRLPPPPKDVIFSCVAIGQRSSLLQEIATMGKGQYIERTGKKSRKKKPSAKK